MRFQIVENQDYLSASIFEQTLNELDESFAVHGILIEDKTWLSLIVDHLNHADVLFAYVQL
jgi:hypothetical protein